MRWLTWLACLFIHWAAISVDFCQEKRFQPTIWLVITAKVWCVVPSQWRLGKGGTWLSTKTVRDWSWANFKNQLMLLKCNCTMGNGLECYADKNTFEDMLTILQMSAEWALPLKSDGAGSRLPRLNHGIFSNTLNIFKQPGVLPTVSE